MSPLQQVASKFLCDAIGRYALAVLLVVIATAIRVAVEPALGPRFPFPTFFIAVMVAAAIGGFGPSLLALMLGSLSAQYLLLPPLGSLAVSAPSDVLGLAFYWVVGFAIVVSFQIAAFARRRADAQATMAILSQTELERRVAERSRELTAERGRFQILGEVSPVGIFRTDATGRCVYVNDRWCQMTGLQPGEAAGEGWASALHPEDRAQVAAIWYDSARRNSPFRAKYRFQQRDGAVIWVLGQAVAERDAEGRITGYIGTITDITELKQAEETLSNYRDELEVRVQQRTNELADSLKEKERLLEDLQRSELELQDKLADLETFHDVAVGRELKMMELEKEVKRLKELVQQNVR
jgi:PAS domain S-box-containing protein